MSATFSKCLVDGCDRSSLRKDAGKLGYCSMHYARVRKHGDPDVVGKRASPAKDWIRANSGYTGDGCLSWPFHVGKDGYGRAHYPAAGPLTTASRLMCLTAHGEAPSPRHEAAHRCGKGNRGCVNPRHLYWALPVTNHADRIEHGTTNRGERQGQSRLTERQVREIRRLLGAGSMTLQQIGDLFGVHYSHVGHIKSGRAWGWLPPAE